MDDHHVGDRQLPHSAIVSGKLIWPVYGSTRPFTDAEIARLECALGKPLDAACRAWLANAVGVVVRFSQLPTSKKASKQCADIARAARRFLELADALKAQWILGDPNEQDDGVTQLVLRLDDYALKLNGVSGPGRHHLHPVFTAAFLNNMLAIAKRSNVLPSTPSRAPRKPTACRPWPAFFRFVVEAIKIAGDVVESSPIGATERKCALRLLRPASPAALSKRLEVLRGRISSYKPGSLGLVEFVVTKK